MQPRLQVTLYPSHPPALRSVAGIPRRCLHVALSDAIVSDSRVSRMSGLWTTRIPVSGAQTRSRLFGAVWTWAEASSDGTVVRPLQTLALLEMHGVWIPSEKSSCRGRERIWSILFTRSGAGAAVHWWETGGEVWLKIVGEIRKWTGSVSITHFKDYFNSGCRISRMGGFRDRCSCASLCSLAAVSCRTVSSII